MWEAGKTHLIEINGEIPPHIYKYLEKELGNNVRFIEHEDEMLDIFETHWYNQVNKAMTPGDVVRTYRENAGWNQTELGKRLGQFSKQYISDIENGRRDVSKEQAKKLSVLFKIPIERLL